MRRLDQCVLRASELTIAGQLDALLIEDLGGRSLLLIEAADPSRFVAWARQRTGERSEAVAYLDFGCNQRPGAVLATIGAAQILTGPPNEQLRRLVASRHVLLMCGADEALARRPTTMTRWLGWCARHLPLSMLCTTDARAFLKALRCQHLPLGIDRLIDPAPAGFASVLAGDFLASCMEAH